MSSKWLPIQLAYINKYISVPFKLYAHIYPDNPKHKQFYPQFEQILISPVKDHAAKLNQLAEIICRNANADDIIMLLDGDAFPFDFIDYDFLTIVDQYIFGAIQQEECFEEPIPHPSFFISRIDSYNTHKFDWSSGPQWDTPLGRFTDVGARIWDYAKRNNYSWLPLKRTNIKNIHPLWFGIYGNRIYHHGAGFRSPISKIDRLYPSSRFKRFKWLLKFVEKLQSRMSVKCIYRFQNLTGIRWLLIKKNKEISSRVFQQIENDDSLQIIKSLFL
jgi:hypothetical protein